MLNDAKVLVVDDTPANLKVVTETLDAEGYEVSTAISGDRCLKRLQNFTPDLILLDVRMPGIDGFETCQQIKANPQLSHVPIIFLTALSDAASTIRGFEVGAVDYINKPFQKLELLARVKTHLQLQQANQRLEQQVRDRTQALEQALQQLQSSQTQLVQHEKMSALGNLVAGVAHEINNPVSFIHGNLIHVKSYVADIFNLLQLYHDCYPEPHTRIKAIENEIDLAFLTEDLPKTLASMQAGTDRIQDIIKSLRLFSRLDEATVKAVNLHDGIDSTLVILGNRLKANGAYAAIQVVKNYGELPLVECYAGQLNQVFMNILSNAIDALEPLRLTVTEATKPTEFPHIEIATQTLDTGEIEIRIADNGSGVPPTLKSRLFDPFFTTKPVGKGTGMGLSISYQIITEKHQGDLRFISNRTDSNRGTTFVITVPRQLSPAR